MELEKQYLQFIEQELGRKLEHNFWIKNKFNVDGYDKETNTVYEYHGCLWHGCPICYDSEDINPLSGNKMCDLYKKTIDRVSKIESLGYNVIQKWACQFNVPTNTEVTGIIKLNNTYRMISNGMFNFKDIMAYVGPCTSFDQFLKSFDTAVPKGIFCHRLTQNIEEYLKEHPHLKVYRENVIELLKKSNIPSKKWFFNELKNESVNDTVYQSIVSNYSNVYDLLVDINNQDVFPAIEATKKLSKFFRDLKLDIHKDAISVSGLALKFLWKVKQPDCEFQLFNGNEDLFYKFKNNLVGGPSIVFNHYQEMNVTRIRNGKHALYLWALTQAMLVGNHQVIEPYTNILEDVLNDKFFDLIECYINVPEHLREYFQDFQPIFKNVEIKYEDLSDETKASVKPNYSGRKLIGSFFAKKMLFHTDLLKWYLKHGLVASNITYAILYLYILKL